MAKVGDIVTFGLCPELCCELCSETIHNHFDCPACGCAYAPSDVYDDFYGSEIGCQACGARFRLEREGNGVEVRGCQEAEVES